jgi:hypothetical protein
MSAFLTTSLDTFNQLLTAGIAVTALALLMYALTFNLRERVARSFALVLACVTIVFVGEAIGSVVLQPIEIEFWLRFQWIGITILPAAYFHASDALLATTGKPSRGRRRAVVRLGYLVSLGFLVTLPLDLLIGTLVMGDGPAPYLNRTPLTWIFTGYYAGMILWAWANFWRAFQRTFTRTGKRRLIYLMAGATAPALGSYPYLLLGHQLAAEIPLLFWFSVITSNLLVTVLLVMMAYAMAFFGVAWPDRVVKARLFRWLLRGPVTASTVLAVSTLVRRAGEQFGQSYSAAVPISMVGTILVMQLLITLSAPYLERLLLQRGEYGDIRAIQELENRLLTTNDLRQFLEAILASVCDRLQAPAAFIAGLENGDLDLVVTVGERERMQESLISEELLKVVSENGLHQKLFTWGPYWLIPIFDNQDTERQLLGLMGIFRQDHIQPGKSTNLSSNLGLQPAETHPDSEQMDALELLTGRVSIALHDRRIQQQIFSTLQSLAPNVDMIQRMRAAARYDGTGVMTMSETDLQQEEVTQWTREALSHYWGGPKLTESPLLRLKIVQRAIENGESPANALRNTLRQAVEQVRPQGERRFTAEWILYNILEMKFMEGRKVREVALRLAMSEADFYRKQRIAIEEVAKIVVEMEQQAVMEGQSVPLESHPAKPGEV